MVNVRFYKVTELPGILVANAFYLVENGSFAETYITDADGIAKKVGNSEMIEELTTHINAGTF